MVKRRLFAVTTLLAILFRLATVSAQAEAVQDAQTPDAALSILLAEAGRQPSEGCTALDADKLRRVLCDGRIRIGVRSDYPQFAVRDGDAWRGYEIDLARTLAARLGVSVEFVAVTPANRIAMLADDRVDLDIASIGHNTQRDSQARFVLPHYYQSETVLVAPRDLQLTGWGAVAGQTVCVTVGNGSNTELSLHGARLLLFDSSAELLDRLHAGTCSIVAQDDSFFAASFATPEFAALYEAKFGFFPVPWGMAVAQAGGASLAHALGLMLQMLHRDGSLVELARRNHIPTGFLLQRQAVWTRADCNRDDGAANPDCVLPPLETKLAPTRFAPAVTAVENWLAERLGVPLSLPMFKTQAAWRLLRNGVQNSLILIAGAITATFGCALAFGALLGAGWRPLRWAARLVVTLLQSSPIVMTLVIAASLADLLLPYSDGVALTASITALGLTNGAYAGQAIHEAGQTLRVEALHRSGRATPPPPLRLAVRRSAGQIEAFMINATKGTPIASFIGAPELLNSLTDITSFSSERVATYWLLLIFYTVAVLLVLRVCNVMRGVLLRQGVAA